jgi:hypothetical protein
MKKSILFLLLFSALSLKTFSQDNGFIGLSFGVGFPIGSFASKDLTNSKSGLANPGGAFDISFGYKLGKNFGLAAMLRSNSFAVDNQVFIDELISQVPQVSWYVESEKWKTNGFYFGAYGSFPVGTGKTSFDMKALIGLTGSSTPQLIITGTDGTVTETSTQISKSAGGFGVMLSAGFRFGVSRKVSLLTNLDYLSTSPEFRNVLSTSSAGGTNSSTFTQPISAISFTAGIALRLGTPAITTSK